MSREILSRGKRVDNGEWVEGYYATFIITPGWMVEVGEYRELEIHVIFPVPQQLANPYDLEGTLHRTSYHEVIPETVGNIHDNPELLGE